MYFPSGTRPDRKLFFLLIGFTQPLDKLEFGGFSTHAVILSVATIGSEVEESSLFSAAWQELNAKILRLVSLAQDDMVSLLTPHS